MYVVATCACNVTFLLKEYWSNSSPIQGLCHFADGSSQSDRWGLFKAVVHSETPSRPSPTKVMCPFRLSFSMSHELKRALCEGVCRSTDSKWLNSLIEEKCKQVSLVHYVFYLVIAKLYVDTIC